MFRSLRNLARLVGVAHTLGRHDALFAEELGDVAPGLGWLARLFTRRTRPGATGAKRPGERLAEALTELGPSFIKLGQALSTRSDLVGEAIAVDLARLQDRLPPFPAEQARATIEAEFDRPLCELFAAFDDVPVAAASIAQVHFATTADGREVAVKVLRPGIEHRFRRDLDMFLWLAEMVEVWWPAARRLKPREVVQVLADTVRLEMDLRMEASAAAELRENFRGDPMFRVPAVDWDLTGRRVMTLERLHGWRVDDVEAITAAGIDLDPILAAASEAFFNQVFRDGFFHADMHPGNMFVLKDGSIGVVDFGIMGRLDLGTRRFLADMLLGFLSRDYRRAARVHFVAGYVPADQDLDLFTQALRAIGEPLQNKPLNEISVGRLLAQLFQVTEQFRMETQPQLLLLQKSMLTAEGVGRRLNPTVNMWELSRPLIERWMRENRGVEARAADHIADMIETLERLPALLRNAEVAASQIAHGGLRLHPDTVRLMLEGSLRRRARLNWSLWAATMVGLAALAYAAW
ncbi:MAG TPA: 2-polyprenylphenol 6-hydroxylase [Azospirillaceae bacterium]|nr:2-polyprenylphenol 6-hydroxylase [Azospirillaceae bacterium]